MTKTVVWGTKCNCGSDCYILQEDHHPWNSSEHFEEVICSNCGKLHRVGQKEASSYYSQRIFNMFSHLSGNVIDFGCGSGFLTWYANQEQSVTDIYAIDADSGCEKPIAGIDRGIHFINGSTLEMEKSIPESHITELVSRDVLMFIKDVGRFVEVSSRLVSERIRHLAWYKPSDPRVSNNLQPESLKVMYEQLGWRVELTYLDWYAYGYFLDARKDI